MPYRKEIFSLSRQRRQKKKKKKELVTLTRGVEKAEHCVPMDEAEELLTS